MATKKKGDLPKRMSDEAWHTLEGDECGKAAYSQAQKIAMLIKPQRERFWQYRRLFIDNCPMLHSAVGQLGGVSAPDTNRTGFNMINSCVQGVESQCLATLPRVTFCTNDARGKVQRRARKLTQFYDGLKDDAHCDEEFRRSCVDAIYAGIGYIKPYTDTGGNIVAERVWPGDVLVDPYEAAMIRGTANMFHVYRCTRDRLRATYPDAPAKVIDEASSNKIDQVNNSSTTLTDVAGLVEAWHLPTGPGTNDGKHIICTSAGILLEEPWVLPFFQIIDVRFQVDPLSWWGSGIAQMLWADQMILNDMIKSWVESYRMTAMPRLVAEQGSIPPESNIANGNNTIFIKRGAMMPEAMTIPIMPADFYPILNMFKEWAWTYVGLNQGAVQATKPEGVNSGTALREVRDNQNIRLSNFNNEVNRTTERLAEVCIELTRMHVERHGTGGKLKGKRFMGSIEWKDCSLDSDQYTVSHFATNDEVRTPADRKQFATEMAQMGVLDRTQLLRIYDQPDVEAQSQRILSWRTRLDLTIDALYDDPDKVAPPDDYLLPPGDPDQCIQVLCVLRQEYNLCLADPDHHDPSAKVRGEVNDALARIDEYYRACDNLCKATQAPPPQPPPMAQGAAMPVSQALPYRAPQGAQQQ